MRNTLALVMPVYNEEACIVSVMEAWHAELTRLEIDFRMIVLNDGSRDGTAARLTRFAGRERIRVINKENSGHGPTILQGYRLAVEQAEWVFQVDSDDEMGAASFEKLWAERERYAALFGCRSSRQQGAGRRLISAVSRCAVHLLFGKGVVDVNTPYRLMRSSILKDIVALIPDDTFAPNILISGILVALRQPVLNIPVPHQGRKTGQVSIVKWRLWKAAACSLLQTVRFRFVRFKDAKS